MTSRISTCSIAATAAALMSTSLVGRGSGAGDSTASASSSASSSAGSTAGSGHVVALFEAFAATRDADQVEALQQDYTFANASNWSDSRNALLTGGGGAAPGGGTPPSGGAPSGGAASGSAGSTSGLVVLLDVA